MGHSVVGHGVQRSHRVHELEGEASFGRQLHHQTRFVVEVTVGLGRCMGIEAEAQVREICFPVYNTDGQLRSSSTFGILYTVKVEKSIIFIYKDIIISYFSGCALTITFNSGSYLSRPDLRDPLNSLFGRSGCD